MLKEATYEILDNLATTYIPEGRHRLLHVNSREAWIKLMVDLLETRSVNFKMATLVKYARNWSVVLESRLSLLN
jgi:hypothetical protein